MTDPDSLSRVGTPASDTPPEAFLEVRSLSKSYDTGRSERLQVLEDINLRVARGQLVAVVGASGSGKSTLLHMLGALDRPDDGEVLISGHSIFSKTDEDLSAIRNRHVGFVFQFHHLLPEFSALENVMMPALIARASKAAASIRATELLEQFGLAERMEHRPGELSGGEKQRVAIARALMNNPDIVLADEPTGNLDEETADVLHQEIVRLATEMGQTVVVVTHNVEFATMADRRLRLEGGHLSEQT